ncbi:hypothetical protein DSLASN_22700 [Desulfoluna limicola]|uniref:Uncharacterized protein n=1 Tax=Desulfoluna limicola TaxID=2810562 RepID=A0ABM7PHG9_9BACT|nr:hypothetical protein DSLASN_22700 [Desulfoluna limicola]
MADGHSRVKGGYDLTRGMRGKAHPLPAFKGAHLAAGGFFFELNSDPGEPTRPLALMAPP